MRVSDWCSPVASSKVQVVTREQADREAENDAEEEDESPSDGCKLEVLLE